MKRLILATLILIAGTVGIANAQQPLTSAMSGHYYDPDQTGQGVELHVTDTGHVLATFFLGRVPGWYSNPVWLSAQGTVSNADSLPLYESRTTVFGAENPLGLIQMGEARLYVIRPNCIGNDVCLVASVIIDGRGEVPFSPANDTASAVLYLRRLL